jgi:hypothetical protein
MAGDTPGYAPSPSSVIGAYAAALDQLWDLPRELWLAVTETMYQEQTELKKRQTTIFLKADAAVAGAGDVVPGLTVSAERLALDGGPATPAGSVTVKSKRVHAARAGNPSVVELQVSLDDKAPRGAYRLILQAPGWVEPEVRIVNFGV